MQTTVLKTDNITKNFPSVKALNDVSLELFKGEIHAIVGENGAGKSTLMKILSGAYPHGSYNGSVEINGRPAKFLSPRDSRDAGVAIIYQELELIGYLNVAENIFLGRLFQNFGIVDWDRTWSETRNLLDSIGIKIDISKRIMDIGIGQQQLVEIAKALSINADILILDEPTAALTESEVELLMRIIRGLKSKGVSCILISHKLNEVLSIADRVSVLRDGEKVGTDNIENLDENKIISMMAGRPISNIYPKRNNKTGKVVLATQGYGRKIPGRKNQYYIQDIDISVREGEILGIAGLMGAGRTELLMSLFGFLEGATEGFISIDGKSVEIEHPRDAIAQGMGLVSEDRKRYGLILIETVARNITLASLRSISENGILSEPHEMQATRQYIDDLAIKTPNAKTRVNTLSGGNQQKVLLARSLMANPRVLFLDEPTRGIDVGAKQEIYMLINKLAVNGTAIIMVSSELPEILSMSDRIIVMREGRIAGQFHQGEANQEKITLLASGS